MRSAGESSREERCSHRGNVLRKGRNMKENTQLSDSCKELNAGDDLVVKHEQEERGCGGEPGSDHDSPCVPW